MIRRVPAPFSFQITLWVFTQELLIARHSLGFPRLDRRLDPAQLVCPQPSTGLCDQNASGTVV
jgi:hypothetical protein